VNVLWVDLVSELGGAQRSLYEVCVGLQKQCTHMAAAVPYGPLYDQLKAAGIVVFPVANVRAKRHGWGLFTTTAKLLMAPSTVAQIIRATKPDIVHANNLPAFLASSRAVGRTPLFWHVRDLQMPPLVAHDASRKATRIIAASEAIDEQLVEVVSQRSMGSIRVIRNGIDPSRFDHGDREKARAAFGFSQDATVVGMIAHLVPWKRHDAFIETAGHLRQRLPRPHFVVVGKDLFGEQAKLLAQLTKQVEALGLTDCFTWIHDLDAPEKILPAFDLLLHPPLREPFGRVICEAMAARVPVVAAESGGPATIIEQNCSGILVRNGDPLLMADAAAALLSDPERKAKITERAHRAVLETFTTQRVCEQLLREYRAVLADVRAFNNSDE